MNGYEKVDMKTTVLKHDRTWEPSGEMSAHEARAFWLEREVASLRGSLERISNGHPMQGSEYWAKGVSFRVLPLPLEALLRMLARALSIPKIL